MAKSKPIGVRFDLDKLDMIQKEQNLTSVQQVVNYLMDNYTVKEPTKRGAPYKDMPPFGVIGPNLAFKPGDGTLNKDYEKVPNKEPKEGTLAWFLKNS
jgi:hypothetical protein